MCFLDYLEKGSHVFAVYPNNETELTECFSFLRTGLDNNEVVFMILEDIPREEIYKKITIEWKIESVKDVKQMEENGDIIITSAKEWYYPDGILNIETIQKRWELTVLNALKKGKTGLRAFVDSSAFFKDGFGNNIIEYDASLEQKFSFPFIAVCVYKSHDVKRMTSDQLDLLYKNHGIVWINDHDVFKNPLKKHYIGLLDKINDNPKKNKETSNYKVEEDEEEDREVEYIESIIENFINEGLKNNEICIYASINVKGNIQLSNYFAKKIKDYQKNIDEGNLWIMDFSHQYISVCMR